MDNERNKKRNKSGKVVKLSGDKTIAVEVASLKRHGMYSKVYRQSKNYLVNNEGESPNVGDMVEIMECRPISKTKKWRFVRVLSANK